MAKPSQAVVDAFEAALPKVAERRKMFGMPAAFIGGNMFAGVFEETIMVRLDEKDREKILKAGGDPFAPMGRTMKEYVIPSAAVLADATKLRALMKKSQAYAASFPSKAPKTRKKAASAKPAARGKK